MSNSNFTRRNFIKTAGAAALVAGASSIIPSFITRTSKKQLGVALVGLGNYSTNLLAPALQQTQFCELRGIVTGSPWKIPNWQENYGIKDENVYNYENMHQVANNPDIDVIYIVLPNSMHCDYSILAAETGKHVWCEKPMATTEQACQDIIDACERNNVKLSIGYRMQHEPNTQKIIKYGETKPYGPIQSIESSAGYRHSKNDWQLSQAMGGGAMFDMGVYPLNAARYCTHEEPVAVTAWHETTRMDLFSEVDETTHFDLEFPSGAQASCMTTLNHGENRLHVNCKEGWYQLIPFQSYSGVQGKTSDGKLLNKTIPNQQARQMDHDAQAILNNNPVLVPGTDGLKDIRVVEAIFKSASTGERIEI